MSGGLRVWAGAAALLVSSALGCASNGSSAVADERIRFTPPAHFQRATREQIARGRWPGALPDYFWGVPETSLLLTFRFRDLPPDQTSVPATRLARLLAPAMTEARPDVAWSEPETLRLGPREWVRLEGRTAERPEPSVHMLLFTTASGRLLVVNFGAEESEFDANRDAVVESLENLDLAE